MHELSIAQSIIDIVEQSVPEGTQGRVKKVRMKIGALAGIVSESLEFGFSAITAGGPYDGAALEIERIPYRIECSSCKKISECEFGAVECSGCGGIDTKMISGNELHVTEIELSE